MQHWVDLRGDHKTASMSKSPVQEACHLSKAACFQSHIKTILLQIFYSEIYKIIRKPSLRVPFDDSIPSCAVD